MTEHQRLNEAITRHGQALRRIERLYFLATPFMANFWFAFVFTIMKRIDAESV